MDTFNIVREAHKGFGYLVLLVSSLFTISLLTAMFSYSGNIGRFLKKVTSIGMILFHFQVLVGVLMFFFSPGFKAAGISMKDPFLRFTYIEHPVSMLVVAILFTIINRYMKTHDKLSLKIVFFSILAEFLILFAFPWSRVFG